MLKYNPLAFLEYTKMRTTVSTRLIRLSWNSQDRLCVSGILGNAQVKEKVRFANRKFEYDIQSYIA